MTIFAIISLAMTAIGLAVWNGYLRSDATKADTARDRANETTKKLAAEYSDFRGRKEEQLDTLNKELKDLQEELLSSSSPDARRAILNRLLQAPGGEGDQ